MVSGACLRFQFFSEVVNFYLDVLDILRALVLLVKGYNRCHYLVNTIYANIFFSFGKVLLSFILMDRTHHAWHWFSSLMEKLFIKLVIFRNNTEVCLRKNRSFGIETGFSGLRGNFILNWFLVIYNATLVIFGTKIILSESLIYLISIYYFLRCQLIETGAFVKFLRIQSWFYWTIILHFYYFYLKFFIL